MHGVSSTGLNHGAMLSRLPQIGSNQTLATYSKPLSINTSPHNAGFFVARYNVAMGQHAKLYNTKTWRAMRLQQLQSQPLCAYCASLGIVTAATVADHVIPHRGNLALFYDAGNLQSLCKPCHDSVKAREENTGEPLGCDISGMPRRVW
jgi:5-methylcytosine-specific restriction enzyme A